jgi:hypothetical protein
MTDDLPDPPVPSAGTPPGSAGSNEGSPCAATDAVDTDDPQTAQVLPPPVSLEALTGDAAEPLRAEPDDEADPLLPDGMKSDGTAVFPHDSAERDTSALFRDRGMPVNDNWQDYLIDAAPLPGEIAADEADEFEGRIAVLQQRRLLLICHAPTPSAEARATCILRKAASELLRREPRCSPLSSRYDRPFAPQDLVHTPQWRRNRLRSVIYLFRSDNADSFGFFNRQIEPVSHLCRTLRDNDSYLLLTVAVPDATSLCEEALLSREIALWRLRDAPSVPSEAPVPLDDAFDATLAACAALFPGLGFREFGMLVDSLVPALDEPADAKTKSRSRADRWHAGERDAVRAELHVVLRAPHTLDDVATADAGAEPGMYLDTRSRRVDTPEWLYERQASVLDHMAEALASRYFREVMTARFGAAYRRLLLRLDALGVRRLDGAWIVQQLEAALRENRVIYAVLRVDELLSEVAAAGDPRRFAAGCVEAVAALLPASEVRLVDELQSTGVLEVLIGQRRVPYAPIFWDLLNAQWPGELDLMSVVWSQGSVIDLLLAQKFLDPACTMKTLRKHVDACGSIHVGWLTNARLRRGSQPPFPFARSVLRNTLARFLMASPGRWLSYAEAVVAQCDTTRHGTDAVGGARRLARDFVTALAMNCNALMSGESPSELYRALLGDDSRQRFADVLASLFAVTSPADASGSREAASVDLPAALLIYRSLTQSLLRYHIDAAEPLPDAIATLSRAWVRTLRREQQIRVAQIVRDQLQSLQSARAREAGDLRSPRWADAAVKALQMLVRSWQHPGRSAVSGAAATEPPVQRRPLA